MSLVWDQEPPYSPSVEIDSSSMRRKTRSTGSTSHSQIWFKQEHDGDPDIIKWVSDAEQDNTLSSAVSTASQPEGGALPPRVMLTITRLQCMLDCKQERIAALERQVEDLQQDRQFLRTQIENLTSNLSFSAYAPPSQSYAPPSQSYAPSPQSYAAPSQSPAPPALALPTEVPKATPKPSRPSHSEPRGRKRDRTSSCSSNGSYSGDDISLSSGDEGASSDSKKKRHHHKERRRRKEGRKRERATGIQYVIHRYQQVLAAFKKKKNMSSAFKHYGIDRNTIANTAAIAELHLAAKETLPLVGMFRPREETLVSYAQKCALVIETDTALARRIETMKACGELLPISIKKSKMVPANSAHPQLGGASENVLLAEQCSDGGFRGMAPL